MIRTESFVARHMPAAFAQTLVRASLIAATLVVGACSERTIEPSVPDDAGIVPPAVVLKDAAPTDTTVGAKFEFTFEAEGGTPPFTFTATGLPEGLTLAPETGKLAGSATTAGDAKIALTVTDSAQQTASKELAFKVFAAPEIATASLASATAGHAYSQKLTVAGGKAPLVLAVTAGELGPDLTLDAAALTISGTPQAEGTLEFTLTLTDANGASGSKPFQIAVSPALALATTSLAPGEVNVPYSAELQVTGGKAPVTVALTGLPNGLTFSATSRQISGTPRADGKSPLALTVTDANGAKLETTLELEIVKAVSVGNASLPDGYVGSAYSQILQAADGLAPYTWKLASGTLPAGLLLDGGGTIAGTPTATGSATISLSVTDSAAATASKIFSFGIYELPKISTASLPLGNVSLAYTQQLQATGGKQPVTFSVGSGTLPAGLTLGATGLISGTPTTGGSFPITFAAVDANGVADAKSLTLVVAANLPPKVVTTSLPNGIVGQSYTASLVGSDGAQPLTWSVISGALPAGLTLSAQGQLTGTPTATGTANFQVEVADANNQTARASLAIAVNELLEIATTALPEGYVGQALTGSMQATGGRTPYRWSVAGGALPAGVTLSQSGSLSGTPTADGSFGVTIAVTDQSNQGVDQPFTLNVYALPAITTTSLADGSVGTSYSQLLGSSGGKAPLTFSVTAGTLPAGLQLSNNGSISGTPTAQTSSTFTVEVKDANGKTGTRTLALSIYSGLAVTSGALTDGYVGTSFAETLSAAGGKTPYTWAVTSGALPAGLTLATSGAISGTPTAAGTASFTVTVTDANSLTASKALTLAVFAQPSITTAALPDGTTGVAYSQNLAATGGKSPYTFSITTGALPAGLALSQAGVISGTPTAAANASITVELADANGVRATRSYAFAVHAPLTIGTATTPDGYTGASYSAQLTATGGKAPLSWSVSSGTLPAGLTLGATTGLLSGTPTAAGTASYTVTVTDANDKTASKQLSTAIFGPPTITTTSLADATLNQAYSGALSATGGKAPLTWSIGSGTLPAGLSLSTSGTIGGTPTAAGTSSFTVVLTDANGASTDATLALAVYGSLTVGTSTLEDAYNGAAYSATLSASGGKTPYTWSLASGSLPAGLSLSSAGVLSGTPTSSGTSTFSASVTDGNSQTASKSLTLTVVPRPSIATASLPDGYVGATYASTVQGANGKLPYGFSVSTGTLPAGLTLDTLTGDLAGTPTAAGTANFEITLTDANGLTAKRSYTVGTYAAPSITTASVSDGYVGRAFLLSLAGTGGKTPYTWTQTVGTLPEGISLSATGDLTGTPTATGSASFGVKLADANGKEANRSLVMTVYAVPAITTTTVADGYVGRAYAATLEASGGKSPFTFAVTSGALPAGLTLGTSGSLQGTPTAAGSASFTVTIEDANKITATRTYTLAVHAAPAITTSSLSEGYVGTAFTTTLAASGGKTPYRWSVSSGSLPAGLTLAQGGTLSGTPTAAGTATFTVMVEDANGTSATQALTMTVRAALQITTVALGDGYVGTAYPSTTLAASGGKTGYTWSIGSGALPAGMALSAAGVLSGTPTAAGTATFTATVTDANGVTASKSFDLAVRAAPSITTTSLTDGYVGSSYAVTLAASGGKSPFTWQVTSGTLPAGLVLSSGGAISGTPTAAGSATFTVSATDANDVVASRSLTLTVHAALQIATTSLADAYQGELYNGALTAAGGEPGYTWTVTNGTLPAGLSLSTAGLLSGTPSSTGASTVTFSVADANGVTASRVLTLTVYAPPTVATTSLANAYVGTAYDQTLAGAGGKAPHTFSTSGTLPAGLTLAASGAITGTPTTSGTSTFNVVITDANGKTGGASLSIMVREALTVSTATLPDGYLTTTYSQTLAAAGGTGTYTWSVTAGALPAGLTLATATGAITGTPTAAGTSAFTVQARDSNGVTVSRGLSIEIFARPAISSATPLPDAYKDVAYSQQLEQTGGKAPITWSVASGTLPAGLTLSAAGRLSGTATTVSSNSFTVQISDANGITATRAFTLAVLDGFFVTSTSITDGYVGTAFSQTLAASGGLTPYTWRVSSGTLPAGLALSTAGVLSGTPTAAGSSTFTVEVKDGNNTASTKSFTQTVYAAPAISTTTLADAYRTESYNATLAATGGKSPFTWSTSPALPAGLTMSATTGAISGTPTGAAGAHTVTVTLSDANGTEATRSLTLNLYALPAITAIDGALEGHVGTALSQAISATGGKTPLTWSISAGALPAGLSISASTGTTSGTPTTAGSSTFTVTATDANGRKSDLARSATIYGALAVTTTSPLTQGWANVAYSATNSASGGKTPLAWSLATGSTLPAGLTLDAATGTISGTPTTAGTSTFTVVATDALGKTANKPLSLTVGAALAISTTALDDGYVGATYTRPLDATGGRTPYTWSLASGTLPPGLALNASTGAISGSATTAGTSSFVVRVTDDNGSAVTRSLAIAIHEPVVIGTGAFADAYVGSDYSATLTASGGKLPYTWSVSSGSLPAGLTLDNDAQVISGRPTTAGTATFALTVTDANGLPANRSFTLVVNPALTITTNTLADGYIGDSYSATVASTGGKAPVTFGIASGSLPAGLSLAADGTIGGTLTSTAATSTFSVRATDANGVSAVKPLAVVVYRMPSISAPAALSAAITGVGYSQAFTATDGKGPFTWSATGLPSGLTMGTTGAITGVPAQTATRTDPPYTVAVTARDANGKQVVRSYALVVREPTPLLGGGTAHGPISDAITVFAIDERGRRLEGIGVRVRRNGLEYTPAKEALTNSSGKVFLTGLGGAAGDRFDVTVNGRGYTNATMAGINAAVVTVSTRSFPVPLPRARTQGVFDESAGALVVFGGAGNVQSSRALFTPGTSAWNDTVTLTDPTNATWEESKVNGLASSPLPLTDATMAHYNGSTVLVGGQHESGVSGQIWRYTASTRTWEQRGFLQEPVKNPSVAPDRNSPFFMIFGGDNNGVLSNRMWAYDPNAGAVMSVPMGSGTPTPREGAPAVSVPPNRIILFGGRTLNGYSSSTFEYQPGGSPFMPGQWFQIANGGPQPRAKSGMVYVSSNNSVYLFGGEGVTFTKFNDLWRMNAGGGGWVPVTVNGEAPPPRSGFAFGYDQARNKLVLFGGEGIGQQPLGDTWTFDLTTSTWTQTSKVVPEPASDVVSGTLTGGRTTQNSYCEVQLSGRSGFSASTSVPCAFGAGSFSFNVPPGDTVTITALNYDGSTTPTQLFNFVDSGEVAVNGSTTVNLTFPGAVPALTPISGSITLPAGWPQNGTFGSVSLAQYRDGFVPLTHRNGQAQFDATNISWNGLYFAPGTGLSHDTMIVASSNAAGTCAVSGTILHGAISGANNATMIRGPADLTPGVDECSTGSVPTASGAAISFRPPPATSMFQYTVGPARYATDWEYIAANTADENTAVTFSLPAPSSLAYSRPMPSGQTVGFQIATIGAGATFDVNAMQMSKLRYDNVTIAGARRFVRQ